MMFDNRQRIIDALSIEDVMQRYAGIKPNSRNRYACPLHGGENNNLSVYPETKSFFCFTCKKGGDLIKFVSEFLNISYSEAITRLDSDYHLGIVKETHKTRNAIAKEIAKRDRRRAREQAERDFQMFSYGLIISYFKWLRRQPKTAAIKFDIEFIERFLDRHLKLNENPINIDVKALIRALYSKHKEVKLWKMKT
jgi:hypothetical protein